MPKPQISSTTWQLLRACSDGTIIVGVLGTLPLRPNRRMFSTSDGEPVHQQTVTSALEHGYLKVISEDGPRRYFAVTDLGRQIVQHARVYVPKIAQRGKIRA